MITVIVIIIITINVFMLLLCVCRNEKLEAEAKSAAEKFEEVTKKWEYALSKEIPQDLHSVRTIFYHYIIELDIRVCVVVLILVQCCGERGSKTVVLQ